MEMKHKETQEAKSEKVTTVGKADPEVMRKIDLWRKARTVNGFPVTTYGVKGNA